MPQTRKPAGKSEPDQVKIEHTSTNAWWCPLCDHSMTTLLTTCAGCGAVRDGDTVTKVG